MMLWNQMLLSILDRNHYSLLILVCFVLGAIIFLYKFFWENLRYLCNQKQLNTSILPSLRANDLALSLRFLREDQNHFSTVKAKEMLENYRINSTSQFKLDKILLQLEYLLIKNVTWLAALAGLCLLFGFLSFSQSLYLAFKSEIISEIFIHKILLIALNDSIAPVALGVVCSVVLLLLYKACKETGNKIYLQNYLYLFAINDTLSQISEGAKSES